MNHPTPPDLHAALQRDGFAFVTADAMCDLLDAATLADWPAFAASWNTLGDDGYLAARGRHRRRRHAVFAATADGAINHEPHQPHYQSVAYNALQGGIERWFEPVEPAIADGASLRRILAFCRDGFGALAPQVRNWRIEAHQVRI